MILSKCAIWGSKNSRIYYIIKKIIKKQEAKGLLSNFGLRTPLSEVPLLGHTLLLQVWNEWNS